MRVRVLIFPIASVVITRIGEVRSPTAAQRMVRYFDVKERERLGLRRCIYSARAKSLLAGMDIGRVMMTARRSRSLSMYVLWVRIWFRCGDNVVSHHTLKYKNITRGILILPETCKNIRKIWNTTEIAFVIPIYPAYTHSCRFLLTQWTRIHSHLSATVRQLRTTVYR